MDHKATIRQFLQDLLARKGDKQAFSDASSLFLSARLDSVDAVDVVVMLEEQYAIDFAEIGFDQSLLDSVETIASLIETARASR